jgi:hypothetical protein
MSCIGEPAADVGNSNRTLFLIDSYGHLRLSKLAGAEYATQGRLRASRFNDAWLTEFGIYRLTERVKRWTAVRPDDERRRNAVRENRMDDSRALGKLTHPARAAGPGPVPWKRPPRWAGRDLNAGAIPPTSEPTSPCRSIHLDCRRLPRWLAVDQASVR